MTIQIPEMNYCSRCVYPSSSAVALVFDENGVCSGCRVHDQRKDIDWDERLELLLEIVEPYRKPSGYECVIGVSGGKDSYYQVHFVKEKLGLNPLLITYNGNNYLETGWENLLHMREAFNVDHYIFGPSISLLQRINRLAFRKMGDMNWHAHAGIGSVVMKTAALHSIPLVFWGEHGYTDLGGMYSMHDLVEYTSRYRKDHQMRGYEWTDMLGDEEDPIEAHEMQWCIYPSDEEINKLGLRGLYIGNYDQWDANQHAKLIMDKYGWHPSPVPFERTYRMFSNLDDRYENGAHDYLKYIKFGYGRGTDHACKDIRRGHMTRDEGVEMVCKYDHVRSSDLNFWLDYVEKSEDWFDTIADTFRSSKVWVKDDKNQWMKRNLWDAT